MNPRWSRWTESAVLLLAAAVIIAGCTGKDGATGPQGLPGQNGAAGVSGTADCAQCHGNSDSLIVARVDQWNHSLHASEDILNETDVYSPTGCDAAICHTSEGFASNLAGSPAAPENPTPIGCRTCHDSLHTVPHNFHRRATGPYTLKNGAVENIGQGNLCLNCHHSRLDERTIPQPGDTTTVKMTSAHYGPHEGPIAETYVGTGAYPTSLTLGSSPHPTTVPDGCVTCHMYLPIGTMVGGHSFMMSAPIGGDNVAVCNQSGCHAGENLKNFNRNGVQATFADTLTALRNLLVAKNLIVASGPDSNGSAYPKRVSGQDAGAIYNFRLALKDLSQGVHNTTYTMQMMEATLSYLRGNGWVVP